MVFVTRDLVREATSVHHRIGGFPFSGSAPSRVLFDVLKGALARLAVSLIWRNEPRGDGCAHAPRGVKAEDTKMETKLQAPELFKAQTYSGPKYSLSENDKEAVAHHTAKT